MFGFTHKCAIISSTAASFLSNYIFQVWTLQQFISYFHWEKATAPVPSIQVKIKYKPLQRIASKNAHDFVIMFPPLFSYKMDAEICSFFRSTGLHFFQIFRKVCCVLLLSLYVKPEDSLCRVIDPAARAVKLLNDVCFP